MEEKEPGCGDCGRCSDCVDEYMDRAQISG
jgi:hypothetical protein